MRQFLKDLSFSANPMEIVGPDTPALQLKPFQLVIWISLSARGTLQLPANAPRLPAILDTGHNHNLSLREEQLVRAGLPPEAWEWRGASLKIRDSSSVEWDIPRLLVDVWLHSNLARFKHHPLPIRLGAHGAACYPAQGPVLGPRLPVVGMRAFCLASLALELLCHPQGGVLNLRMP
jgi:hypothetical protein